jgi:hypothetical protein
MQKHTTYDPNNRNNPPYTTIYQPTPNNVPQAAKLPQLPPPPINRPQPSGNVQLVAPSTFNPPQVNQTNYVSGQTFAPPSNTSTKNANAMNPVQPANVRQPAENVANINSQIVEKISDKIWSHFKTKYPATIDASGFNRGTIVTIVEKTGKKEPLNEKTISKIIDIIDHKFRMTINSNNREGKQYDTTGFSMDKDSKITMDKYLENYTNKVTILLDSDKPVAAELPKNMGPANDMVDLKEPDRFGEDFPIKDRSNNTDMIIPEVRTFDYYIMINSNDRNTVKSPAPNNFIIDFAPAPSGDSPQKGYIDRSFHNIKSCELLNVVVLDTSAQPDSSDAGGKSFPYLMLQFDELQNNYYGTNSSLSKSFAILTDYLKTGNYKYYRMVGDTSEYTVTKVFNPRINLSKLTTKLLLPDGTPFNFGSAYNNDTSNSCISFGLRLTTIQKNLATSFMNNA